MKKTVLFDRHKELNAKIVDFAGYTMPISYSSVNEEHIHVRNSVGIFDVSHMGQLSIEGQKELAVQLEKIIPIDLKKIKLNQSKYSFLAL